MRHRLLPAVLSIVLACLMQSPISARADESAALPAYNADLKESSISGISSGGYMAVQFGTAWSSIIKGVGIVAGGPYFCAEATSFDFWTGYSRPMLTSVGPCMSGPTPDINHFIKEADEKAAAGEIDPTSNLLNQKVYIFHGFNDIVVARTVTDTTAEFYRHYLGKDGAPNLFYQTNLGAGHAQVLPLDERSSRLNTCELSKSPYINECGYDQAGVILQHIYGALNAPNNGKLEGTIKSFGQGKYTGAVEPGSLSMGDTGYVFVPKDCENGAPCRVHVALHGCGQDAGEIGTLYVEDSGYNAWADTNRIIVLYPQTMKRPLLGFPPHNPMACWDWWSYITHDDSYVTKSGKQIQAIKAMLDGLTAGFKPGSPLPAPEGSPQLVVIDITDNAADLAWTPAAGADGYSVSRAEPGGDYVALGKTSGPSFADNGLKPSTAYRWRVAAIVQGKEGVNLETTAKTHGKPEACNKPGSCPLAKELN